MIVYLKKYNQILSYIFFGFISTIVNIASYWITAHLTGISVVLSVLIAWILSVSCAYFTNRKWVFKSEIKRGSEVVKEFFAFISCRISTCIIDIVFMHVAVTILLLDDVVCKMFSNIIVVILNFVFSKCIVFKTKKICVQGSKGNSDVITGRN